MTIIEHLQTINEQLVANSTHNDIPLKQAASKFKSKIEIKATQHQI